MNSSGSSPGARTTPCFARPSGAEGPAEGHGGQAARGAVTPSQPPLSPCRIVLHPLVLKRLGANSLLHPWPGLSLALPPGGLGERWDVGLARNEFKSGPVTS